jgi:hypothetical protein
MKHLKDFEIPSRRGDRITKQRKAFVLGFRGVFDEAQRVESRIIFRSKKRNTPLERGVSSCHL